MDVFRRFFERIVERCQTAELVWGHDLSIDATKVAANAALDSLQPRFAVEAHLTQLFDPTAAVAAADSAACDCALATVAEAAPPLARHLPETTVIELTERSEQRHDWLAEGGRPDRTVVSGAYQRTADFRVSTTDPDASPLPLATGRTRLGYQDHYVVDGGRARIILAVLVAPAEVQENQPALDLLWRACFRWKLRPQQITGDTKYATVENLTAIEGQGINAYMPLSKVGQRAGQFGAADFIDDAEADVYQCPGQAQLTLLSQCNRTHRRIYQAPAATCRTCALRDQCTTSTRGRRISRSLDEATLDRVRGYHETEPYAKALRKRQVWVEPLFAEGKQWHGLRQFRLRGLTKVNGAALLIATGQNLKRLLSARGWGRRPWPGGAVGLVLLPHAPSPMAAR